MTPPVSRVAFSILGIDIMWYAVLIVIGMYVGIGIAAKEAGRKGMDPEKIYDMMLWVLPLGIVGARIYYVIFEWDSYGGDFLKMINIREGGLAIHGGLLVGLVVAWLFCKKNNLRFLDVFDATFPGVAMGQAIGRWGNFINQEAYGAPTDLPWALVIDGQRYHPTFLYESIGDFFICLFLLYYARNKQKASGQVFALYLILYGILRFFVEGLRMDSLYFMGLRVAQLVSLTAVVIGIIIFNLSNKKASMRL